MTDRKYEDARHIRDALARQREEDDRVALIGHVVFLLLGFTLGALLI